MSEDVVLEALQEKDLAFLLDVRNECREFLHDNREFSLAEAVSWFRESRPVFYLIYIGVERVGYIRLGRVDPQQKSVYVGADLHYKYRGKGYARKAYLACFQLLREQYGIKVVKLEVLSHNARAIKLYQSLGFKVTDRLRDFAVREGVAIDNIFMSKEL